MGHLQVANYIIVLKPGGDITHHNVKPTTSLSNFWTLRLICQNRRNELLSQEYRLRFIQNLDLAPSRAI